MSRSSKGTVVSKLCRLLPLVFKKLFDFVTMRRLLMRVVNRVLLSDPFTPAMSIEAEIHTHGRRRLVSVQPLNIHMSSAQ